MGRYCFSGKNMSIFTALKVGLIPDLYLRQQQARTPHILVSGLVGFGGLFELFLLFFIL